MTDPPNPTPAEPLELADDVALLTRYVERADAAAFAELARRFGPLVRGVCRRRLGRAEDAEDAAQAAFLALAERAGTIREPAALAGWLHRVAVRAAARAATDRPVGAAAESPAGDGRGDPPAELARREALAALDEELLELPAAERDALLLCHLRGLPRAEAAARLGVTEAAVKGRLARGRRRLRGRLARRGVAPALAAALAEDPAALAAGPAPPVFHASPAAPAAPAAAGAGPSVAVAVSAAVCLTTALAPAAAVSAARADDAAGGDGPRAAVRLADPVRAALAANAAALDPIAVEATDSSSTTLPPDRFTALTPWSEAGRPEFTGPRSVRYAHAGGRTRWWRREVATFMLAATGELRAEPTESERAFDGENVYAGTGASPSVDGDPHLAVFTPAQWRWEARGTFADCEYLRHAGFAVPTETAEVLGGMGPTSRVLAAAGSGELLSAGPATVGGRAAYVVRLRETDDEGRRGVTRFVLDPDRNYAAAVVERFTADGRLRARARCGDFRPVGGTRLRLPGTITVAQHLRWPDDGSPASAEPLYTTAFELTAASADPPAADAFAPALPPGTHVTDATDPAGTVRYRVPDDPAELPAVLARARAEATPHWAGWARRLTNAGAGWAAGLLALLVAAAATAAWRLRR